MSSTVLSVVTKKTFYVGVGRKKTLCFRSIISFDTSIAVKSYKIINGYGLIHDHVNTSTAQ